MIIGCIWRRRWKEVEGGGRRWKEVEGEEEEECRDSSKKDPALPRVGPG